MENTEEAVEVNSFQEAILMGLLWKRYSPPYTPQNRADRRRNGERGHKFGLGSMAVPKTRKAKLNG